MKSEPLAIVEVRSATQVAAFVPMTTLPKRYAGYRLAGYCGTGIKPPDELAAWCCARCHDLVDGRSRELGVSKQDARLAHAEGVLRTIAERLKAEPKPAPKPKKRKTPFNTFDAEPKSKTMQRNSHKAALRYATGIKS